MDNVRTFRVADLFAACAAVVVIGCVVAGCVKDNRGEARRTQNVTHVRGIHSGCVLFGQGCKDFYPGLAANGEEETVPLVADAQTFGTRSTGGYDPAYRMTKLLRGNYFSPEYAVSPLEPAGGKTVAKPGDDITSNHFSYAMLRLNDPAGIRKSIAWRSTNSSAEAVLSDRNLGAAGAEASLHGAPWSGAVVFNDNSAKVATSPIVMTSFERGGEPTSDHLFADDKDGKDAAMVFQDASSYVNQK